MQTTISLQRCIVPVTILFTLMLLIHGTAHAQGYKKALEKTPEERAAFQTEYLQKTLGLSATQVEKLHAVNLKYAKEMEPLIKSAPGNAVLFREAKKMVEKRDKEYLVILSEPQFQKYLGIKKKVLEKASDKL